MNVATKDDSVAQSIDFLFGVFTIVFFSFL